MKLHASAQTTIGPAPDMQSAPVGADAPGWLCDHCSPPPPALHAAPESKQAAAVIRTARSLIGTRYQWGGTSPATGFDCSGFIWYVYSRHGIHLPRTTDAQYETGQELHYSDLRPGDLIFHDVGSIGKSLHVGILTDRGTFIHAPGSGRKVMESSLNNVYWREHYLGGRRVLD